MEIYYLFTLLLYFNYCCSILVKAELKLCSENVTKSQICKKSIKYRANTVPKPWPVLLKSIVDLKNILAIDPDKKTMTADIYLIIEWIDPEINVINVGDIE